jgi:hypothetical protein
MSDVDELCRALEGFRAWSREENAESLENSVRLVAEFESVGRTLAAKLHERNVLWLGRMRYMDLDGRSREIVRDLEAITKLTDWFEIIVATGKFDKNLMQFIS